MPRPAGLRDRGLRVVRSALGERRVHSAGRAWRRLRMRSGTRVVLFRGARIELDPGSANSESVLAGRFERALLDFVLARLGPGDSCVDVGAHVGYWTLPLAVAVGPPGRVVAVEAFQPNVERLRANLARNGVTNTEVRHAAASDVSGTATLRVSGTSSSWNSIVSSGTYFQDSVQVVQVPAVALDDLNLGPVDLVKIDVEGAEQQVIAGAGNLLSRAGMLVMEVGGARVTSAAYVDAAAALLFSFDRVLALDKRAGALVDVASPAQLRERWTDVADVTKLVALRQRLVD